MSDHLNIKYEITTSPTEVGRFVIYKHYDYYPLVEAKESFFGKRKLFRMMDLEHVKNQMYDYQKELYCSFESINAAKDYLARLKEKPKALEQWKKSHESVWVE